ncbi:ROK family protein [Tolumonas osonensis]|uniref:Putative NBD/HSP70 family sugar kinase n=1 Tax=Tolumonas osonensis TaxID=675874 RepID=A0A841GSM8_9GAMM|nr:ROK family protein [Tolumonas osonensis]MBB6056823.1 putative NBD/HSP70 family sugar kinase [Tolumonas osonensis]
MTKITQQLLNDGIIEEVDVTQSSSQPRSGGRPQTLLQLTPRVNHSLCFYVSTENICGNLIDQTNTIIDAYQQTWDLTQPENALSVERFVDLIKNIAIQLCGRNQLVLTDIKIITVATQGKLAQASGNVFYSQLFKDKHFNLTAAITAATGVESKIFNIAYCSSHRIQQLYPQHDSFIAVLLGYGVGVGIVIDKQIILGPEGTAPEISHVTYSEHGPLCYCGARGCAETYLTYHAILGKIARSEPRLLPDDSIMKQLEQINLELSRHNTLCEQVIREAGRVLGHVLSQLITIFNIKTIILNGEVSVFYPLLKEEIDAYLSGHSDYRYGAGSTHILREPDDNVAFLGLIELTNESYLV